MRSMFRTWLVISVLALTAVACAQNGQPNFSGYWKMDPAKSDYGPQDPPQNAQYTVRHVGAKLTFDYTQDGKTNRIEIVPDNEERVVDSNGENDIMCRAYWQGKTLVMEGRERQKNGQPTDRKWVSKWTLSDDGQAVHINRHITLADHEADQSLVFVKITKEQAK